MLDPWLSAGNPNLGKEGRGGGGRRGKDRLKAAKSGGFEGISIINLAGHTSGVLYIASHHRVLTSAEPKAYPDQISVEGQTGSPWTVGIPVGVVVLA
jgi:hypothetical protein